MRRIIAVILALATLLGIAGGFASAALADGDPASDVLVFDPVFNPPDSGASRDEGARLAATVAAANRAGYAIRVALVNSSADLGTVTQLWQDPVDYSFYLRKELSLQFHGVVLVAMPQGYGLAVPQAKPPPQDDLIEREAPPGADLAGGASRVVLALARANGMPLRVGAVALPRDRSSSSSPLALIGLIIGAVAVVGAWAASLRVRPLRRRAVA